MERGTIVTSPDEDFEEEEKDIVPGYTDITDRVDYKITEVEELHTGSTFGPGTRRTSIVTNQDPISNMDRLVGLNKQGMENLSQGQFLEAK